MKRITALITVFTLIFTMAVTAWATESSYVAVSLNKPISALVNPDEGHPEYANDDSNTSRYTGSKNNSPNALTIDLERKYILHHVITYVSNAATSSIYVSNDSTFDIYIELEFDKTESNTNYFIIPSAYSNTAYRYVRFNFTASSKDVLVRNFQAYTTEENAVDDGPKEQVAPSFEEELIKVSENKSILSKQYGTGAGWGTDVVANAVDSDPNSQFISCQLRDKVDWVTIDLEEATVINKIVSVFTVQRTYSVYVTNTSYGQQEEFADGIKLNETSDGSKVFVLPDEYKNTAYRYVRFYFEGDAPNTGSSTEQNIYIKDISVYKSTRDVVYNAAEKKLGALTDGDIETAVTVANNTVIDLLTPTYISSYEFFGEDKDNVKIKGSLFNTTVNNMTEIPKESAENNKYRYITIVSDSGEAVSLNEVKIWSFFSDVVTPWTMNGNTCSVTVTNTSHKDDRTYTFTAVALDEYNAVIGIKTATETLEYGSSKDVDLLVYGLESAKKVVCTIERDDMLVSAPAIFIDGANVPTPGGTPYTVAPEKDIESAVVKTDYNDGLKLTLINTYANGVMDSDILTFSIYNSANELFSKDASFANGVFKYRLPGDADAGEYKALLLITDAVGNSVVMKYSFTKTAPTETDLTSAINAFTNVSSDSDFQTAYQTYYVANGVISFSDIPEVDALLTEGIGDSFVKMMSARSLWKNNANTALTAEDIRDCAKAAVVENSLENGRENAPTILAKYATTLDNVFDGNQNNIYTAELFKKGAANKEELIYNMKVVAALSQINNSSSEKIVEVLQNYSSILSVDLSSIETSGVDIYLVAKRLDNTIPESYKDGLADEIAQILAANQITEEKDNKNNSNKSEGGYVVRTTNSIDNNTEHNENTDSQGKEEMVFVDVADNFWASESIKRLAAAGIISGRGDGSFDPDSEVSRAEFITMLVNAFKLISVPDKKPEFSDCDVSDWFYPFVDAAVTNNIVKGISETEFKPAASIKRQDACVMSYNMMVYKNYLKYFAGKTFTDSDGISSYAVDAVNMLSGSGVISGFDDGSFGPHKLLSRAQAAVIINRFMVLLGEEL